MECFHWFSSTRITFWQSNFVELICHIPPFHSCVTQIFKNFWIVQNSQGIDYRCSTVDIWCSNLQIKENCLGSYFYQIVLLGCVFTLFYESSNKHRKTNFCLRAIYNHSCLPIILHQCFLIMVRRICMGLIKHFYLI